MFLFHVRRPILRRAHVYVHVCLVCRNLGVYTKIRSPSVRKIVYNTYIHVMLTISTVWLDNGQRKTERFCLRIFIRENAKHVEWVVGLFVACICVWKTRLNTWNKWNRNHSYVQNNERKWCQQILGRLYFVFISRLGSYFNNNIQMVIWKCDLFASICYWKNGFFVVYIEYMIYVVCCVCVK